MTKLNVTVHCGVRNSSLPTCGDHSSACLYDVENDPCEFNNIVNEQPDIVAQLKESLLDFASRYV